MVKMKPIKGFPRHFVAEDGKIWSENRKRFIGGFTHKNNGYVYTSLCYKRRVKCCRVHRIVAEAFVANPKNLSCVNHKDGNKENNHYLNLEWCTNKSNTLHAINTGLMDSKHLKKYVGENHSRAKLTSSDVLKIRDMLKDGISTTQIAKLFPIDISGISNIKYGRTWKGLP